MPVFDDLVLVGSGDVALLEEFGHWEWALGASELVICSSLSLLRVMVQDDVSPQTLLQPQYLPPPTSTLPS